MSILNSRLDEFLNDVDGFLSFETMAINTQNDECLIRTRFILSDLSFAEFRTKAYWVFGSLRDESIPEGWNRRKILVSNAYDVERKGYITIESIYPDTESI